MTNAAEQWNRLCDEHERAKEAYMSTFSKVNAGFRKVYEGDRAANPSFADLEEQESAWKHWQDVIQRMASFARTHA